MNGRFADSPTSQRCRRKIFCGAPAGSTPSVGPSGDGDVLRPRLAHVALRAVDLSLAATAALTGGLILLSRRLRRHRTSVLDRPRLMAIDSMYPLSVLRERNAEHLVTRRDLGGYFEHVWSVHPFVGLYRGERTAEGIGSLTVTSLNDVHTMVEGKFGRFASLARLPFVNFALAQLQLLLLLDRIVDRENVAIVRGDPYYHGLLALLLGALSGRPVEIRIIANHDEIYGTMGELAYPGLFRSRAVEQRVVRFTLSRAHSVVVFNDDNRMFAVRNGASVQRLARAANAIMVNPIHLEDPLERDALDDEFGLADRPVVACVSRLAATKHPEDVVASVAKAHERDPRIAAVIVGDGPMRSELENLSAELGVADDIVFAGERDQRWIASMLARSTVVAAPLAGLALVESALSGTPIVAYDVEWHGELIRPDQEGILVTYRDTDAMGTAIHALVQDPGRAGRLGAAARRRALQIADPTTLLARERELADRLLAEASARS